MELDPSVPIKDDCLVYRLIRPDWIKVGVDGRLRPKSQAFSNSSEDGTMSVFLADGIEFAGLSLDDILGHEMWRGTAYSCWQLPAGLLRVDLGQTIVRDPIPEIFGHGAVSHPGANRRPDGVRAKMALLGCWAHLGG